MAQPGEADALAGLQAQYAGPDFVDPANNFVARDDGRQRVRQLAIEDVQIGTANSAGGDTDADFAWSGMAVWQFGPYQSGPG